MVADAARALAFSTAKSSKRDERLREEEKAPMSRLREEEKTPMSRLREEEKTP